jgi:hypothetical protein
MEETLQQQEEVKEETKEEVIESHNIHELYIPTEWKLIDWNQSWKKCRCGRLTGIRDNWCPSCGQKLGRPPLPN